MIVPNLIAIGTTPVRFVLSGFKRSPGFQTARPHSPGRTTSPGQKDNAYLSPNNSHRMSTASYSVMEEAIEELLQSHTNTLYVFFYWPDEGGN